MLLRPLRLARSTLTSHSSSKTTLIVRFQLDFFQDHSDFYGLSDDFIGPTATEHNGTILIDKPGSHADAIAACKVLNEGLLSTSGAHFQSDIKNLMSYLSLQSRFNKQKFWVASGKDAQNACTVVSLQSGLQSVPCNSQFPVFCSQSAPYRRNVETDQNPAFQVQVQSKKLTVVG